MDPQHLPAEIDTTVAHPARVYDYILGGTNHFPADRELADTMAVATGGLGSLRDYARANRDFLRRAVLYLVHDAGVRQFLDIGTGIPSVDNVHGVAQRAAKESRIVYVDNDPIVLAHAHVLLDSTSEGAAAYVHGDLRDPRSILLRAAVTLDLNEPVAVMIIAILHLIGDDDDPYGVVSRLLDGVPSGSYFVLTHMAADLDPETMAEFSRTPERVAQRLPFAFALRHRDGVARFLDGLELVDPGLVRIDRWRPDPDADTPDVVVPLYGAVARKP